jgi:hypothetical protein
MQRIDRELRAISPFRPRLAQSVLGEDAVLRGAVGAALAAARERVFARTTDHNGRQATG